jgi:hypothetical protein
MPSQVRKIREKEEKEENMKIGKKLNPPQNHKKRLKYFLHPHLHLLACMYVYLVEIFWQVGR